MEPGLSQFGATETDDRTRFEGDVGGRPQALSNPANRCGSSVFRRKFRFGVSPILLARSCSEEQGSPPLALGLNTDVARRSTSMFCFM